VEPSDVTEEEFYISDGKNDYIKVIHHKMENGNSRRYCVDLRDTFSTFSSTDDFAGMKLQGKGQRDIFKGILVGHERELEYDIGNMMKDFLKKIRILPPWRKADPLGQVSEGTILSEDGVIW
jgi:hypothetical protein